MDSGTGGFFLVLGVIVGFLKFQVDFRCYYACGNCKCQKDDLDNSENGVVFVDDAFPPHDTDC